LSQKRSPLRPAEFLGFLFRSGPLCDKSATQFHNLTIHDSTVAAFGFKSRRSRHF
jgi:hypothetical protein